MQTLDNLIISFDFDPSIWMAYSLVAYTANYPHMAYKRIKLYRSEVFNTFHTNGLSVFNMVELLIKHKDNYVYFANNR